MIFTSTRDSCVLLSRAVSMRTPSNQAAPYTNRVFELTSMAINNAPLTPSPSHHPGDDQVCWRLLHTGRIFTLSTSDAQSYLTSSPAPIAGTSQQRYLHQDAAVMIEPPSSHSRIPNLTTVLGSIVALHCVASVSREFKVA